MAHWLTAGQALDRGAEVDELPLVIDGWLDWLAEQLREHDDETLRKYWQAGLNLWSRVSSGENESRTEIILIVPEVGRGIVPLESEQRRLRDLAGWLAQDAACVAQQVWYVRHGLVRCLKSSLSNP
ncbi:bifunctional adenosylcobinamide kinase/adenosylcobinamide-phosphate guanylyltransferase [Halomonas huangheensis]|uniref:bifunctional adenosylcobinamide kinase/adenosylcobinamide-phosphate guanylyltransferase n=1 Tax=Halomonas huangheensis TaxID=1178482 RepID=UPI00307B1E7A